MGQFINWPNAVAFAIGYLIGCLNLAWFLGRHKHIDMTRSGSGNLGASNTVLHLGLKYGLLVAIHDIAKAVIAVLIVKALFPGVPYVSYIAGAAAILGHIFPFWRKFSGGKGFASFIGLMLATDWRAFLLIFLVCCLLVLLTDYIVSATFTSIAVYPVCAIFFRGDLIAGLIVLAVSVIIFCKHIENVKRIMSGEESSVRKAVRGKKRE